jgi:hypothetical protein
MANSACVRRSAATLRKPRCIGGGPRFRTLNTRPYYTQADLTAWIKERLTAPVGSTSERDRAMPRNTGRQQPSRLDESVEVG